MPTEQANTGAGFVDVIEQKRLNECREAGIPWKMWGPTQRATVGHGARRLQPGRQRVGIFSHDQSRVTPTRWGRMALAASPRRTAALLCLGLVERARSDPQGARLWPDQRQGEPRRGRQRVLLLPRLDPDAFVYEVSLQVPTAGVPVWRPWKRTGAGARDFEYELIDTGVFDDNRYFDVFLEYAKAGPRRHPDPGHRP